MTEDVQNPQQQIAALEAEVSALKERIIAQETAHKRLRQEIEAAFRQNRAQAPRPPVGRR